MERERGRRVVMKMSHKAREVMKMGPKIAYTPTTIITHMASISTHSLLSSSSSHFISHVFCIFNNTFCVLSMNIKIGIIMHVILLLHGFALHLPHSCPFPSVFVLELPLIVDSMDINILSHTNLSQLLWTLCFSHLKKLGVVSSRK